LNSESKSHLGSNEEENVITVNATVQVPSQRPSKKRRLDEMTGYEESKSTDEEECRGSKKMKLNSGEALEKTFKDESPLQATTDLAVVKASKMNPVVEACFDDNAEALQPEQIAEVKETELQAEAQIEVALPSSEQIVKEEA
jgi:hypothetical protein